MISYVEDRPLACQPCHYPVERPVISLIAASAGIGSPVASFNTAGAAKAAADSLASANANSNTLYGHRKDLRVYGASSTPPEYYATVHKSTGPYSWMIRFSGSGFVRFHWYFMQWDSSMGPWIGAGAVVIDDGIVEATWERGSTVDVIVPNAPVLPDVAWPSVNSALDERQIDTIYCVIPDDEIFTHYPIRVP